MQVLSWKSPCLEPQTQAFRGWGDGSEPKSTSSLSGGPWLGSWHPHVNKQSFTPILEDPVHSFGLCEHSRVWCTDIRVGKTPVHKLKTNELTKPALYQDPGSNNLRYQAGLAQKGCSVLCPILEHLSPCDHQFCGLRNSGFT